MLRQRQILFAAAQNKSLMIAASFMSAIESKNLSQLHQMIADGENVNVENSMGQTPLEFAFLELIKNTDSAIVKGMIDALLAAGANPNHCNDFSAPLYARIMRKGSFYCTGNFTKCRHCLRLQSVIPRLIQAGANLNARPGVNNGNNALHVAARMSMHLIIFLKQYRVDVNAQNDRGETPLMIACDTLANYFYPSIRVISHLRAAGANAALIDLSGKSALDRVLTHKHNGANRIRDQDWDLVINYITRFNDTDFHVNATKSEMTLAKVVALDYPATYSEELELIARSKKNDIYKTTFFSKPVAVKVGNPIFGKKAEMLNEIHIFTELAAAAKNSIEDSAFIVKYFGATAVLPDNSMGIVLELAMPLLDYVRKNANFRSTFHLMSDVIAALAFLHQNHIVHRDISLGNILVRLPDSNNDKSHATGVLTDFSNAKNVSGLPGNTISAHYSNREFAPPECRANPPTCSAASDIYTLANVFSYMLFHHVIPLQNRSNKKLSAINESHTNLNRDNCPEYFLDVLTPCLQTDPAERPTAEQMKTYVNCKRQ